MDEYLVNLIKNQVINEIKKDYFLVKKTGQLDKSSTENIIVAETFIHNVIDIACEYFKIKRESILAKNRKRIYTDVRFLIYIVCRDFFNERISLEVIGKPFKKHHASVHHGYNAGLAFMETNEQYRNDYEEVKKLVTASFKPVE